MATACDGDCGPDAILRNLERLQLAGRHCQQVLQILQKRGREAALQAIRLLLLMWISDHASQEVLPEVTVESWVSMEAEYGTLQKYLDHMRKPRSWIDAPMLIATSAVFEVQLVCPTPEPQLIVAPSVLGCSELPILMLANVNNVHFYALCPAPTEDGFEEPVAALKAAGDLLIHAFNAELDQDLPGVPTEDECSRVAGDVPAEPAEAHDLWALVERLVRWEPFGSSDFGPELPNLVKSLELGSAEDMSHNVFQVLQWRDAVKLWQWEQADQLQGLNREHEYCLAKRYCAASATTTARHKQFAKSQKLWGHLSMKKLVDALAKPCEKGKQQHKCLDAFRAVPLMAFRWRKLWQSLPKLDRTQRLQNMFSATRDRHTGLHQGDAGSFHMKFHVLGLPMCRQAFVAVTGIHADALHRARHSMTNWANCVDCVVLRLVVVVSSLIDPLCLCIAFRRWP